MSASAPDRDPHRTLTPDPAVTRVLGVDRKDGRRRRYVIGGVVGATLLLAVALRLGPCSGRRDSPVFESVPVVRGDILATVTATGRLQGLNTVEVGAEVSGRVIRTGVDFNDKVKKGQILAEIDPEQMQAAVDESRARLASAEANILQAQATAVEARKTLARAVAQSERGLVSLRDLEAAEAAALRADANVASSKAAATLARATLTSALSRLKKTVIVAPIDGIVLARLIEPGQTVTAGFQTPVLFKLADDLTRMVLYIDIDEADIGRVGDGQEATFTVDAYPGKSFSSKVLSLRNEPKISQNVVTYEGVLSVDNDEGLLRPGMTATATIVTEAVHDVMVVPNAALRFSPPRRPGPFRRHEKEAKEVIEKDEHRVWIVDGLRPKPVVVKPGVTDGARTEIREGELTLEMRVIVNMPDEG